MAISESSTQTPQDDIAHLWHTFAIQSCPVIKADFPGKELLYGLFHSVIQRKAHLMQVLSQFKCHHIFYQSPEVRHCYHHSLPSCTFVHGSQPYHATGSFSFQYFPYSILQQEATQFLQDSDTWKSKNISISEKVLKN